MKQSNKSKSSVLNSTILTLFISINYLAYSSDIYVGNNTDFHVKGVFCVKGNTSFTDGLKFSSATSAKVLLNGDVNISTNTLTNQGSLTFANSTTKNVNGKIQSRAIYLTSNSSLNLNGTGDLIATDSLSIDGTIKTNSNLLELGTSSSNVGSLNYTSGYIDGNFKRWFSNATSSDILFPIGASTYNAFAKVSYTTVPTNGGALIGKHTLNTVNPLISSALSDASTLIDKVSEMNIWQFEASDGLDGGNYDLEVTPNLIYGVVDVTELRIVKRATSSDPWVLDGSHVIGTGTIYSPVIKRSSMSGFSQFAIGGPSINPLPVTLTFLNTECTDNGIEIKWQTASEYNSSYFNVEKSRDGLTWNVIDSIGAAGNSVQLIDYSILDDEILTSDVLYYRLNQFDQNGVKKEFGPISTKCDNISDFNASVYPNPTLNDFSIELNLTYSQNIAITIYGNDGKEIAKSFTKVDAGNTIVPIDRSNLKAGMYTIQVSGEYHSKTMKLIGQ